jgi:transposase
VAYEALPTRFGLARAVEAAGIECVVAAPSLIPRSAAGRLRKRGAVDAQILVQALRGGDLTRCARPPRRMRQRAMWFARRRTPATT